MKLVTVTCIWRSRHVIEVPDDWSVPSTLDGFPPEILEEIDSRTAELVDCE